MKKYSKKSKNIRSKRWWQERLELQKTENLFTTFQMLEGIEFQWADFYFIGKKPDVYAATISTAKYQYAEDLFYPAWDIAQEIKPVSGTYWTNWLGHKKEEDLIDGVERFKWIDNKMKELADADKHPTYEKVTIADCKHAWLVSIVINKPSLTVDDLNEFIANWDFKPYKSSEPLTFKSKDLYWGVDAMPLKGGGLDV